MKPTKVTLDTLRQIIDTRKPLGRFYAREGFRLWVGVDNDYGEAWTEAFRTRRQCLRWLRSTALDAGQCGALSWGKEGQTR
ncbi:MAG: hypothetical protein FWB76_00180 [Oscillospiraceae bacterium]|nr:hypothetical protein [Oscillospiraceae bacterium]